MTVLVFDVSAANRHPGVSGITVLPEEDWSDRWDRIICDASLKRRLLNFALFCLVSRHKLSTVGLPTHGLLVLAGPPGTGKTTLAHGLAYRAACELVARDAAAHVLFVGIDPHALPSEMLGGSQRATAQLFERAIPDIASEGYPVVVLLDEVEALAVNRRQAATGANPVDVHRATEAVLTGIDSVAENCRNVAFVATTNHAEAVDEAFLSRADVVEHLGLPSVDATAEMLEDCLTELVLDDPMPRDALRAIAEQCVARHMDARQVRKLVLRAVIRGDMDLALSPRRLRPQYLEAALE